jgi:hypothetical protein
MLISKEENFTFIHVPKCGGLSAKTAILNNFPKQSIRRIIGSTPLKDSTVRDASHFTIEEIKEFLPEIFDFIKTSEIYCTIRDPYKRFFSSYFFEKNKGWWLCKSDELNEDFLYYLDSIIESFDKKIFVHKFDESGKFFDRKHRHAMPQMLFIKDNDKILPKNQNIFDMSEIRANFFIKNKNIRLAYRSNVMKAKDKSRLMYYIYKHGSNDSEVKNKIGLLYKEDFNFYNYLRDTNKADHQEGGLIYYPQERWAGQLPFPQT